jgi:NAD+-dependent secondary alcohol dehydrogenase Adh1
VRIATTVAGRIGRTRFTLRLVKAALLREYHQPLELVERPRPEPVAPTDVVVRVGGAGVCATDLHAIDGLMEPAGVSLPRVLGHENAGWVEEVGSAVTSVAPGDAVLVYPAHSCGLCVACRRGNDMHCARHQFTGLSVDGGFAEYLLVPERSLLRLLDGIEPQAVAPHADAGLTAYHAVRRLAHRAVPGTTAVVVGIGGVGHVALQLLRELGSSRIVAVDVDERRRRLAAELGVDDVVDGVTASEAVRDLTAGRGADLVFDFVGTDETHAASLAMLVRDGVYSVVGYGGTIRTESAGLVVGEHSVIGNLVGTWVDLWELLQLHAAGRVQLRIQQHPFDAVNEVLGMLRDGEITGRAVLVPDTATSRTQGAPSATIAES